MEWNAQQDAALLAVDRWLKDPNKEQVFRLFGYAGTGKTTLARHLAEGLNSVFFAAFTGKASHVLKQKGCPNAATLHSLIYRCKGPKGEANLAYLQDMLKKETDPEIINELERAISHEAEESQKPRFKLNELSAVKWADLVVVDEASMVGTQLGKDLTSFGCPILALGDPFQLPPVRDQPFFSPHSPDVMLTDVERQAKENPVLWLATKIRNGGSISEGSYGDSRVVSRKALLDNPSFAMDAHQILVGRNATRHASNKRVREMRGLSGDLPVEGDRVVCLRNNHMEGLLNGSLWDVQRDSQEVGDLCVLELESSEEASHKEVLAWSTCFGGGTLKLPWFEACEAEVFDYGWTLTVHKSQGSQWDRVLLVDESGQFNQDASKHLYTGITRAAERITVAV
jgi:exodeoxyribonuclease V